jgi:undecaprenyl diphosphate synthase
LLDGNPEQVLQNEASILLTKSVAVKYFGNQSPVGTLLKILVGGAEKVVTITGVVKDPRQIWRLPENIQDQLAKTMEATARNNGITLTLALSYGGRTEIVDAVRQIAADVKDGRLDAAEINEQVIAHNLYTHSMPDPDLLIRTSGEMRVSNFLLWQISYAEFVITPTLWPDFGKKEFYAALEEYSKRQRRYGGV